MAKRPWLMFFGLIFSILVWLAGLILLGISGYTPSSEENTTLVETIFSSYTVDEMELHLHTPSNEIYKINFYQYHGGIFDAPSILCIGDPYKLQVNDGGTIKAMQDVDGEQLITFESEREAYRSSQRLAYLLLPIILILNIVFLILALVVSRNPEWYPAWLVKILFANASEF